MIKLYMKQKVFSWVDKFSIKDENGEDKYFVKGEFLSIGKKLHLYDANGNELAFIRQKVLTFLPRFFVSINGREEMQIVKEFTFLRPKYRIEGLDWQIQGDFWSHNYEICSGGSTIVRISKVWFSWGDSYELYISNDEDELPALAAVLAVDCVLAADANSST